MVVVATRATEGSAAFSLVIKSVRTSFSRSCRDRSAPVLKISRHGRYPTTSLKQGSQEINLLSVMMADYIHEMLMGDAPYPIPEVRFRVLGDRSFLRDYLNELIDGAEAAPAQNSRFNLQIALGYGGRLRIAGATKLAVSAKMEKERLSLGATVEKINEAGTSRHTYSALLQLQQIDAIIRTSGENRLSGFALWESHHAEFAIIQQNWPALR